MVTMGLVVRRCNGSEGIGAPRRFLVGAASFIVAQLIPRMGEDCEWIVEPVQKSNWSMFSFVNLNGSPRRMLSPAILNSPSLPALKLVAPGFNSPFASAVAAWMVR